MNFCHTDSIKHLQININMVTHQEISNSSVIFTDPCTKGSSMLVFFSPPYAFWDL